MLLSLANSVVPESVEYVGTLRCCCSFFFFLLIHRYSATGLNLNAHYARNWERTVYIARKIESESKYLFIFIFFFCFVFDTMIDKDSC